MTNLTPIAYIDSLRIGTIDYVSPDEIKAVLDIEAPDGVALNTGIPRPFPRINGYVLIPSDDGYLVAQIEWVIIERSPYPKRKGMQDFGLVDLPYPLRKMSLNPLGRLVYEGQLRDRESYRFRRGVESYPTVGDAVLLPTQGQLRAIVESGEHRRVKIGISPLAGNAEVRIDPDRLFGRHLAVLGNTGSGKSCSVAGLIRWSMEEAMKERGDGSDPNARFILLDPNGEYANTFRDMQKVRIFAVEPSEGVEQLRVPLWFWNSVEWSAFTQASSKAQRPTLIQALRSVREGAMSTRMSPSHEMRRYLRTIVSILQIERNAGRPWANFPYPKNFFEKICKLRDGLVEDDSFSAAEKMALRAFSTRINDLVSARTASVTNKYPTFEFTKPEIDALIDLAQAAHASFGGQDIDILPIDADVPRSFSGDQLLRSVVANAELLNVSEYVETMLMRIRTILSDSRMKVITASTDSISLEDWLTNYIGDSRASNGTITVIDLSLVPAEVIHIIAAVIARMTLEALQRYRKQNKGKTLPTVLVMEEAHTFIKRYTEDVESPNSAAICCQVFEKIAREGRKFGLGLVLSSQRPSELSPTVLSQCNSFLLHRISNDRDQELVQKLVPDNLRGILRDLASLPSQTAILLGWASELPVLVRINTLLEEQRPKSDDPEFWNVWVDKDNNGNVEVRSVDWKSIASDWQQLEPTVVQEDSDTKDKHHAS